MARSKNGMLGVGGQRRNISRKALRGEGGPSSQGRKDAAAQKKELLERMRARNAAAETGASDSGQDNDTSES
ncbi:DUF6243 family protein [Actinomadura rugatobispora]|uniref:DUF6243 family protein n=1 Tax=Actinomadura rugatobispora TaxID=1994 RepID=A0ABW1A4L4_9ACTN|nr:hypothetical protein GCM10010200_047730 [Actinomadura rugatobispora]